jgi:hypothetical protein
MLEIGKTLVSLDVLRKTFCCNLHACKGSCCILGDAGAPLTITEAGDLEDYLDELSPYLRVEGLLSIIEQGAFVYDTDGEIVTPLINNKECAFTVFEEGIASCAIERAFHDDAVPFNKPVSCHLYPIRIKSFEGFDAVNYDVWDICKPATEEGARNGLPAYLFVKDALIRKYGVDWFEQLDYAAKNLDFVRFAGPED